MAAFFKFFLPILLVVVLAIVIFNVLKIYVLDNIKINKWIPLVISLLVMIVPNIVWPQIRTSFLYYVQMVIFLLLFLWFMDLAGLNGAGSSPKNENKNSQVIRSKAKPNRVAKNKDMEVINTNKKKKKKK